ncbi:MAG: hypothetical protein JWN18_622 [Parcubacteria group bacterium]|nr:hypothetical protein [Parcubacteria group bacterium]
MESTAPTSQFGWKGVALGILGISLVLRVLVYPVVVSDYTYFIKVWFSNLHDNGLAAFAQPFADYAPLYLYLLKLLSYIPVSSLYSAKTLSFIFDVLIAVAGYFILKRTVAWANRSDLLFLAAVTLLALPTVLINSSLWAQSDALYTAGVVGSLFFMLVDAPLIASLLFGVAISFKLQAIFFSPILIGYLVRRRDTWPYLIVPPGVFFLTVLPAWFSGGSLSYWLFIYGAQSSEYKYLSVSAQSIFAFLQPLPLTSTQTDLAFWAGLVAAGIVAILTVLLIARLPQLTIRALVTLSLASALVIPYLLPRMHERYFYLADIIATLYAWLRPDRWWVAAIVVSTSLMSYMPFLSGQVGFLTWAHVDLRVPAMLLLIPISTVLYDVWNIWRAQKLLRIAL